ncbi:SHOCT domain-containing protein [Streptomyces sp. NPDC051183]|uniref:SHOCT domain-containing protein n=1 Tax=unclassified Streptomyces TaxID=2593676 RepID=UPI003429DAE8
MFIRPVGVTVRAANRPAGHPLLQGLLSRAAGPPPRGLLGRAVKAAQDTGAADWEPEPDQGRDEDWEPEDQHQGWDPEQEPRPEHEPEPGHEPWPPDPRFPQEPPPAGSAPPSGLVSELTRLADLAREGLLTPEEFTTAKARLLRG